MTPRVVTREAEVRQLTLAYRRAGERLALVPTMGALHEGHLSLVREARRRADRVALTIFVNPLQFGPTEDLDRYPKDFEGDLAKCAAEGVDLVFHPSPAELYPKGFQTHVEVPELSRGLCGKSRPGHFRGVATVVAKLLGLFRPEVAIFGQKDFQQLRVIERLVQDLSIPTAIVGAPIVREADGLARSSRNAYLSPDERRRALCLCEAIARARESFARGVRDAARLRADALALLEREGARVDYVELCDPDRLGPIDPVATDTRLLLAAFFGTTRLIDNAALSLSKPFHASLE